MTSNGDPSDSVLAALKDLPGWDVDERRAQRLRVHCRAVLAARTRTTAAAAQTDPARWAYATGLVLLASWCGIYVFAIVSRAVAVWGH